MEKYNILFVVEELSPNGAMKSLVTLLKALDPGKYSISLFLFRHNTGKLTLQVPEYVKILSEIPQYKALRMSLKDVLKESLKKGRLDLAFLRLRVAWQRYRRSEFRLWSSLPTIPGEYDLACSYADGFVAPLILKKVDARATACWIHYMYSMMPQPEYVYDALRNCSVCVPVSFEAGKALDKALGIAVPKRVVHNIIDAEECRLLAERTNKYPRKNNCIRIVSIGRVTDAKRFDIIPETALVLKKRGLVFEWLIAGTGDRLEELRKSITDFNLENDVKLLGELDNPMPLLRSADVFVNPSRHESWGMTVSEALCLGKVVITSDIAVFAEQIENDKNGFMREPSPAVIARTIHEIIKDENLRKYIEYNASRYPYTKSKIVREFDELVAETLA